MTTIQLRLFLIFKCTRSHKFDAINVNVEFKVTLHEQVRYSKAEVLKLRMTVTLPLATLAPPFDRDRTN